MNDYKEHHTDATVHFEVELVAGKMAQCMEAGLENKFKLTSKISTGGEHATTFPFSTNKVLRLGYAVLPAALC